MLSQTGAKVYQGDHVPLVDIGAKGAMAPSALKNIHSE